MKTLKCVYVYGSSRKRQMTVYISSHILGLSILTFACTKYITY